VEERLQGAAQREEYVGLNYVLSKQPMTFLLSMLGLDTAGAFYLTFEVKLVHS
jgi:hypothetical protein